MPSGVYSTRFIAGLFAGTGQAVVVPDGKVMIVRDVDLVPVVAGEGAIELGVNGVGFFFSWDGSATPAQPIQWRGRQVVNSGETLTGFETTGQEVFMYISGYLLDNTSGVSSAAAEFAESARKAKPVKFDGVTGEFVLPHPTLQAPDRDPKPPA